ncbi:MAG: hypothetical protein ACERKT_00795 [Acidobacteriota bacterium]
MEFPRLGNPLKSEGAAFRWLVAVLIAAIAIAATAKLISPAAGMILALVLAVAAAVPILKGLIHMLGSPDDD